MRIYPRKGSPYLQFDAGIVNGRRFRGSTGETTRAKAKRAAAALVDAELQRTTVRDEWRLRDLFGAYYTDVVENKRSADEVWRSLEYMNALIGRDKLVSELTTKDLLDYRPRRQGINGCQAVTVNRDFATLKAALRHASEAYGKPIPRIAWKSLFVKENEHRVRFASETEFAALLTAAHPSIRPVLIAAVTTGLRKANILALEWHQIDMDGNRITIPRTKGRKPTVIKISGPLRGALVSLQPDADKRKGPVFDVTNFRKRWDAARAAAKITDFRFHDLRHTFASWARMSGADIADIKDAMDHSSIAVTMRYAHVTPGEHQTAFDRVGALISPESPENSDKLAQNLAQKG